MSFKFDWLNLESGDILLSRGQELKSKIISKATDGHFSHAMLYVGGTIIHADGEGVYSKNPQRIYAKNENDLAVYRLKEKPSARDMEKICETARSEVGKLYDFTGAVYSIARNKSRATAIRQFCSKLVAYSYSSASINFGKSVDKITPNDFCRSNNLEIKKDLILPMNESELAFAKSPDYNIDLQHETFDFLAKARDFARKNNRKIGTINDVLSYLIEYPEDDETLCRIIEETRYFGFVNIDREKNPYRYDLHLFKDKVLSFDASEQADLLRREEIGLSEEVRYRLKNYLWSVRILAEKDLSFFRKNHELHRDLYLNTSSRLHVVALFQHYQAFLRTLP